MLTKLQQQERATRQFVTIENYQTAYFTLGNPQYPALFFVHGWLSHAGALRGIMEMLQDRFYCIALDHLGFGFSDKPANGDYSIPNQTRRLLALADHLGIDQFALIGHSMGGQIALNTAITAPKRVQKVVTIGGVVDGSLATYFKWVYYFPLLSGYYLPASWAISHFGMRNLRWYKYMFLDNAMTYRKDVIPLGSLDIEMSLIEGIERPAYLAFHALQAYDLTPRLSEICVPVLIIHGEQDNTVAVASGRLAHSKITNSQLVIYDPCGHTPYLEIPPQFEQTLKGFL